MYYDNLATNDIPIGIVQFSANEYFKMEYISDSVYSYLGYTVEEISDMFENNFLHMVPPDEVQELLDCYKRQIQTNDCYSIKTKLLKKAGNYIKIQIVGSNYIFDNNSLVHQAVINHLPYSEDIKDGRWSLKEIMDAIAEKQFEFYLQPKVSLQNGDIIGAEALVRWRHPIQGVISPNEFIPTLEKRGLITQLDYYIWREVCCFLSKQINSNARILPISVNVSRVNLSNNHIVNCFKELIEEFQIPAKYLHIEITESAYMDNTEEVIQTLEEIKKLGIAIEMDDFGTGYSSLSAFNDLPIDVLKLDMQFLVNINTSRNKKNLVKFILRLANNYNIPLVAEGIETKEQLQFLQGIGCQIGQGYYFSPPMNVKEYSMRLLQEPNYVEKIDTH